MTPPTRAELERETLAELTLRIVAVLNDTRLFLTPPEERTLNGYPLTKEVAIDFLCQHYRIK